MCTIMLQRETLPAEKRSRSDSQKAVDKLMAYDKLLSEPFTRSELQKFFGKGSWEYKPEAYSALTDAEKKIVDELGLVPQSTSADQDETSKTTTAVGHISRLSKAVVSTNPIDTVNISDYRRYLKASLTDAPNFTDNEFGYSRGETGKIYVWLDNMCFGNSSKKGFYYVRWYNSMLDCHGFGRCTTAYGHPALIVQKDKLRPDQIEYMERKCKETRETKDPRIEWGK